MSDQPITRDAWVDDFIVEVQRLRRDLEHSLKYLNLVAQTEWARTGGKDDPRAAAKQGTRACAGPGRDLMVRRLPAPSVSACSGAAGGPGPSLFADASVLSPAHDALSVR